MEPVITAMTTSVSTTRENIATAIPVRNRLASGRETAVFTTGAMSRKRPKTSIRP
jgi:hypothetical protein